MAKAIYSIKTMRRAAETPDAWRFIYVMAMTSRLDDLQACKIGVSKDPIIRCAQIKRETFGPSRSHPDHSIQLVATFASRDPYDVEKSIHDRLADNATGENEWFDISPRDAINAVLEEITKDQNNG